MPYIPPSTDFKLRIDQRRLIINAAAGTANPPLTRAILFGLLSSIEDELNRVLNNPEFVGTSVEISVDPAILALPTAVRVRNLLVALGYTVTLSGNTATISW